MLRKRLHSACVLLVCTAVALPPVQLQAGSGLAAIDAFHVGRYHLAEGNREKALDAFNDALRMNPQFVQAYIARGKLLAEMGRYESALADLNFALRLQPSHAEGFAYRGFALLSIGKPQEAMSEFDMALRLDPSYARVHYLRGQTLRILGNEPAAEAGIATALRLDPSIETTRVITASADDSSKGGTVHLAGPTALERTSIMADTQVQPPPPLSRHDQGRVLRYDRHPVLAHLQAPSNFHGVQQPPVQANPPRSLSTEALSAQRQATPGREPTKQAAAVETPPEKIAAAESTATKPEPSETLESTGGSTDALATPKPSGTADETQTAKSETFKPLPVVELPLPPTSEPLATTEPTTTKLTTPEPTAIEATPIAQAKPLTSSAAPSTTDVAVGSGDPPRPLAADSLTLPTPAVTTPSSFSPLPPLPSDEPAPVLPTVVAPLEVPAVTTLAAEPAPVAAPSGTTAPPTLLPLQQPTSIVAPQSNSPREIVSTPVFPTPAVAAPSASRAATTFLDSSTTLNALSASAILNGNLNPEEVPAKPAAETSRQRLAAAVAAAKQSVPGTSEESGTAGPVAPSTGATTAPGVSPQPAELAPSVASAAPAVGPHAVLKSPELPSTAAAGDIVEIRADVDRCRRRGLECEERGNLLAAQIEYDDVIRLDPTDPQNFCLRGHLHLKEGRMAEAAADFESAIRLAPGLSIGYFGRAHLNYTNGKYADAVDDYSVVLRLDDTHAQALFERGHCYARLGQATEAESDRLAALALDPAFAKHQTKYGAAESQPTFISDSAPAGDVAAAVVSDAEGTPATPPVLIADAATAKLIEPRPALKIVATPIPTAAPTATAVTNRTPAEAQVEITRLTAELAKAPGDASLYVLRAQAAGELGRFEDAVDDLNAALRIDAERADALRLRAEAHAALNRYPAAQADLTSLLKLEPNNAELYAERGTVSLALGLADEAVGDLTQALALDDGCTSAYCSRGLAYVLIGENGKAMTDFAQAIERNPRDAEAYLCRAKACLQIGREAEALEDLNTALGLDPELADAYFERSRLYAKRGAYEKSQSDRKQALKLDPTLR
jgi:tetratricopeptide (TPR) repeat protein